jgi:hypothetical protein
VDLEHDELRQDHFELAVFGFQQERFCGLALGFVPIDEEGDEYVRIDDDLSRFRCALCASGLPSPLERHRRGHP